MNDWGVPMCGLKRAGTMHKVTLQSVATPNSSSSGGGLQPIGVNLSYHAAKNLDLDLDLDLDVVLDMGLFHC
jgi:hypothetical protein